LPPVGPPSGFARFLSLPAARSIARLQLRINVPGTLRFRRLAAQKPEGESRNRKATALPTGPGGSRIRKVFNLKWQVFEAGFSIREIRKDNRGDEPGEAGKGRPQLVPDFAL
jgi:hypothetical protein